MEDAVGSTAASRPLTAVEKEALEALEFNWGEAYMIGRDDEHGWWASRRDHIGGLLTATGPDELRAAIRADYGLKPVPRSVGAGDGRP